MSALAVGLGILGAGFGGRVLYQMYRGGARGADKWIMGGFKAKMDKPEAIQILGLRWVARDLEHTAVCESDGGSDSADARSEPLTPNKLKDAHRKLMLANHPDR